MVCVSTLPQPSNVLCMHGFTVSEAARPHQAKGMGVMVLVLAQIVQGATSQHHASMAHCKGIEHIVNALHFQQQVTVRCQDLLNAIVEVLHCFVSTSCFWAKRYPTETSTEVLVIRLC